MLIVPNGLINNCKSSISLHHKLGTHNRVADALSRKHALCSPMKVDDMGFELIRDLLLANHILV